MFETLTDRLTSIFQRLSGKGRLTENDVDDALKQVRMALLGADVNFRVARDFVSKVREKALGNDVLQSVSPGQQVVKIVHEEMIAILSGGNHKLTSASRLPTVVMLVGLQGSGKTTSAAKLALHLRRQGHRSLLVAADLRRPAAVQQLTALGNQLDVQVYQAAGASTPVEVAFAGVSRGKELGVNWVIIDTGGRLHVDEDLMNELVEMEEAVHSHEVLLVLDSMTGQDAVQVAQEFKRKVNLTGLIMTKMDGDARGGAALSITQVTGTPIKYIGTGEKTDGLESFYPDRLASRILGMGDVVTLVEKAQEMVTDKRARELEQKMRRATFDLEDFLEQIQSVKKMGSISSFLEMVPGFSQISKKLPAGAIDESGFKRSEAIVRSMTISERRNPDILNGSRRRRIAHGSGTTPQDVNQVINQFRQAQKLMKQMTRGRGSKNLTSMIR
jgi:signal recognition particle subunit SRP54